MLLEIYADPPSCESPLKVLCHLLQYLAIRFKIPSGTQNSCCAFCFTSYKDWQRHDEKFLNQLPLWRELFLINIFQFSLGKAAMNSLCPWKEGLTIIGQNAMLLFVAFLIVKEI